MQEGVYNRHQGQLQTYHTLGNFLRYFFDHKREKYDLKNSYFLHIFNEKNCQGLENLA